MSGVIVHEWLQSNGGSENVFDVLSGAFPDAARLCLWNDSEGRFTDVEETVLARTPLRRHKAFALPLTPASRVRPDTPRSSSTFTLRLGTCGHQNWTAAGMA